jgi:hypothetical protein
VFDGHNDYRMTLARLIPLPIHAALEVAFAPVVIAAPFALGLDPSALIVAMIIGVLLMGTGLATTSLLSGRAAPQGLRVSAHVDLDLGIALASAISALAFAIAGDMAAGGFFAAIAVAQGLLAVTTRYSARA